ncbi:MAG TPA: glycosyltransferase family 4 protein [Chloroflexota bacterium]|nr:glycosyltransferase family 4 protein [Chloroflexota bacterium]
MLSPEYPPYVVGGLGAHVGHLAPELAQRGVNVHVVTPRLNRGEAEERDGNLSVSRVDGPPDLPEYFLDRWRILNRSLFERAAEILRAKPGPWLVHGHDWLVGEACTRLQHECSQPLLATIHATEWGRNHGIHNDVQRSVHAQEQKLAAAADHIIACSHFMAKQVSDVFGVPPSKIDVIPNGVDVSHLIDTTFDRAAFRAQYAQPDEPIVLQVGRVVGEKGIFTLLDAIPRALAEVPKVRFIVVGSGPALEEARKRAAGHRWSSRVLFTGFVADEVRNRLYQVADAAVFPSIYEPFGIVALEAMALGVPVVSSNAGGLAEVVDDQTAVVVEPDSAQSLARGIVAALRHPDPARTDRAKVKATTQFTWGSIADETVSMYRRMLPG